MELFRTHFKDESEFDNMMDSVIKLGESDEVLGLVSRLKDTENYFLKQREFGLAVLHYDLAAKYLLCMWMASRVDFDICKALAISLYLDLAACALKQRSFSKTFDFCSVVININPDSTKARFTRAKATFEVDSTTQLLMT